MVATVADAQRQFFLILEYVNLKKSNVISRWSKCAPVYRDGSALRLHRFHKTQPRETAIPCELSKLQC